MRFEKESGVSLTKWRKRLERAERIAAKAAWRKGEKGMKRK
jgi:hypothetical protein